MLGSAGETDEVVTIDVRRQIRWPTSLHGKSGMRVSEFPLGRLDPDGSHAYNPLHEAFVLGMDDAHEVEWVVDDAVAQFGERRIESTIGERFQFMNPAPHSSSSKGGRNSFETKLDTKRTSFFMVQHAVRFKGGFPSLGTR